jgi:glucan phosphoethanolaminetransferase (alkaline phosphatase superfamily)
MVEILSNILTGFGLSVSAGLNAYIPLLIVALMARFTDLIRLNAPYDTLTNGWVIGALAALALVEVVADKIPAVDTVYNLAQSVARPVAGAILFAASTRVITDIHPALALLCGLLVAGTVHAAKTVARPIITAVTAGVGDPAVSTAEDVVSGTVSLVSILTPLLALVFIVLGIWFLVTRLRRTEATF